MQFPRFSVFIGQKSIFRRYCIQNVKDGIQVQAYNIYYESVNHFSHVISVKFKKNLRKSKAKSREVFHAKAPKRNEAKKISGKVKKIQAQAKDGFLIKKCVAFIN